MNGADPQVSLETLQLVFRQLMPTAFTWIDEFLGEYREMRLMIDGIVIIVLFLGFRRGVVPTVTDWFTRVRRSTTRAGERASAPDERPDEPPDDAPATESARSG